jgi:N6-adenosine-specific RNA methylase IME4
MTAYGAILADPPWRFSTYSARGKDRAAERWYDCMSLDDICTMDVSQYAARDCVLFLWVTDPFLREAFRVSSRRLPVQSTAQWPPFSARPALTRCGSGTHPPRKP